MDNQLKYFAKSLDLHMASAIAAALLGLTAFLHVTGASIETVRGLALTIGGAGAGVVVASGLLKVRQRFARNSRMRELGHKYRSQPKDFSESFDTSPVLLSYHKDDDDFVERLTKFMSAYDFEVNYDRSGEVTPSQTVGLSPIDEVFVFIASKHSCRSNSLMASFDSAKRHYGRALVIRLDPSCQIETSETSSTRVIEYDNNFGRFAEEFHDLLQSGLSNSKQAGT